MPDNTSVPPHTSLYHLVCSWNPSNLSEISNKYSSNSSKPQTTFSTYDSYKNYFEPLLFAEISSELLATIDKYERSNTIRNPKIRSRREESGTTVAQIAVKNVSRSHSHGFGWHVDIESNDKKGPIGCVENDIVVIWKTENPNTISVGNRQQQQAAPRKLPVSAVLAVVLRATNRTGCRILTSSFPDGNENGLALDLEEGEENEEAPPTIRVWNVLKIGSLTTMKREYDALQRIKTSQLLPKLLRPYLREDINADKSQGKDNANGSQFRNEEMFTGVVANKMGLNSSQVQAILYSSTCRNGFAVIQGPPGTGKTRTLIAMLNVIHMTQYHEYYEGLLASISPISRSTDTDDENNEEKRLQQSSTDGSLLGTMMTAMNNTVSFAKSKNVTASPKRPRRPRLLICAPSNSAVDEILTRLTKTKFYDGQGRSYCPELARVGAGDRVSDSAKPFTAEGQAEAFLDRLCSENMDRETQKRAQLSFLSAWQSKSNALLTQLARTPKRQKASQSIIIDLHEKLERMDRDLRRLLIVASDGEKFLSREEKLRQIARTYVEDAQLVFATLSGSASSILTKKGMGDVGDRAALFDTVVIDEGAQATETSCLIPITLGASRCLLVGDPQQLPATVLSSGAAGLAYGQSLLERVCRAGQAIHLLDTQYRMHPAISSFPRRYFYKDRLVDDESVQGDHRAHLFHRDTLRPKFGPYVFLDITEGEEKRSKDDKSVFNSLEAELAAMIYTKIKKEYPSDPIFSATAKVQGSVSGFGVVTPYKRQMQELRQSFDRAGVPTGDVEIDTVDAFQGREKEVIVFSCVRTAAVNRGIGFVRDVRRMNVGLTRARASLIILGSAQALAEGSSDWAELVEDATSRGCLISVSHVSRCLEPPSPMKKEHIVEMKTIDTSNKDVSEKSNIPSAHLVVQRQEIVVQRPTRQVHPSDPRRRAHKTLVIQNPPKQKAVGNEPGPLEKLQMNDIKNQILNATKSSAHVIHAGLTKDSNVGDQSSVLNLSTASNNSNRNPSQELQDTLRQVTKLLSEAGFRNSGALETTLKEHMQNGGILDLETVMAAAIATNDNESRDLEDGLKEILGSKSSLNTKFSNSQNKSIPQAPETVIESGKQPNSSEVAPTHASKGHKAGNKGSNSGWDMLFSDHKKEDQKNDNDEKAKPQNKREEYQPPNPDGSVKVGSDPRVSEQVSNYHDKNQHGGFNANANNQAVGFQFEQGAFQGNINPNGNRVGPDWAQSSQDEQAAQHQYTGIQQMPASSGEDGNFPNKRLRAETPKSHLHQSQGESNVNDQWSQQQQFDPTLAFSVMPNVMTQPQAQMTGAQGMDPMHFMQQQALQQQMLQQQIMQQQAMQQQALQQQMMQQQAMQQQGFPQDAMLQQAAFMQMSGGAFPTNGLGPGFFPMNAFPNQQAGSGEEHTISRGGQWNRGKFRGRNRGRGKYRGGRDKRRGQS